MDPAAALRQMRALLRPGGVLGIIGLARTRLPPDLGWELAAVIAHRWHMVIKNRPTTPENRPRGAVALREAGAGEIVDPGWSDRQGQLVEGSQDP